MPVTIGQRTFGQTVVEVARQRGLILAQGTATAATGTTLTDATNMQLPIAQSDQIIGKFLYIYGGTSAGTVREITSYGTIGVFTWTGTATMGDTTSTWVLLNADPRYIIDAVTWAQGLLGMGAAKPYDSTSLVTNSYLEHYGDFEEWGNGTAAAPDGWTLGGAGAAIARTAQAMATDITVSHGLYSAGITPGAGAVAILARQLPWRLVQNLSSQNLYLRGTISEAAAGNVVVRVGASTSAGVTTNTDRTGTYTTNRTERLASISTAAITMPALLIDITLQVRVAAAATIAYVDDLMLLGPSLYDYELPASLVALRPRILVESREAGLETSSAEHYDRILRHKQDWMLRPRSSTTPRTIHFHEALPSARHLLIQGINVPAVVTATTTNLNFDAYYVAQIAAQHLAGPMDPQVMREAERLRKELSTTSNGASYIWLERSNATT